MKTSLDIENILFTFLKASSIATEINGGIYKRLRPAESKLEDIVINCLPINNAQLQSCVANVNIHVPNLSVQIGDITNCVPNHTRLNELATEACMILNDQYANGYLFTVQQQNLFEDEDDHMVNIRIDFNSVNL
jgi:hypothetical protein